MKKYLLLLGLLFFALPVKAETLIQYFGGHRLSIAQRIPIALECGIQNYTATAVQNNLLLSCLKQKDILVGRKLPQVLPNKQKKGLLGATYSPVTGYQSRTTQYISAAAATIPVASTKDKALNQIALSNISSSGTVKVYMNLEPGTSNEEPIICTGVTTVSWTGCTRGISFQGNSETASTTIAKPHNAGAAIIITNIGQFFNQYVSVDGNQQINDVKTFTSTPLIPTASAGNPLAAVNETYVSNITLNGAATSTENNLGLVQLNTQTQLVVGTASSSSGAPLVVSNKFTSSSSTANRLIATQNNGKFDPGVIDTGGNYTFSASNTFSGATTTISKLTINASNGNINNISYKFPSQQATASSTVLFNDGNGGLIWDTQDYVQYISTSTPISTTTIRVTGIPAIRDIVVLLENAGSPSGQVQLQFNNDRGNNYWYRGYEDYLIGSVANAQPNMSLVNSTTSPQYYEIHISNMSTQYKKVFWSGMAGNGNDQPVTLNGSGSFNNSTSTISTINFLSSGNFGVGTRLRIYVSKD